MNQYLSKSTSKNSFGSLKIILLYIFYPYMIYISIYSNITYLKNIELVH